MEKQIINRIEELKRVSTKMWGICPDPKIEYSLKGISTFGTANQKKNKIRLHKPLLMEFGHIYIEDIFVHEYAHIVVGERQKNGHYPEGKRIYPHGEEFKEICDAFGIDGSAFTDLYNDSKYLKKLKARKAKKSSKKRVFYYSCGCAELHELTIIRHNKIQRGTDGYRCMDCQEEIKFVKEKID